MLFADFPATPLYFTATYGNSKSRIFLARHEKFRGVDLIDQVTTLIVPPDQARDFVSLLNQGAHSGHHDLALSATTAYPKAVQQSIVQALQHCPSAAQLALGTEGVPMEILRQMWCSPASEDVQRIVQSAVDLSLQLLITNERDECGEVFLNLRLLSDEVEVFPEDVATWWPTPNGMTSSSRSLCSQEQAEEMLLDHRWETQAGRIYWVWALEEVTEDSSSATAEWVVEFFDAPIPKVKRA